LAKTRLSRLVDLRQREVNVESYNITTEHEQVASGATMRTRPPDDPSQRTFALNSWSSYLDAHARMATKILRLVSAQGISTITTRPAPAHRQPSRRHHPSRSWFRQKILQHGSIAAPD
jgi:hypothetical protein